MNRIIGTLDETLNAIASRWGLDSEALIRFAADDPHTGWDFGTGEWPSGSLHRPEGQTLYALIRLCKAQFVVEFGSLFGCSGTHLGQAVADNGVGHVDSVDPLPQIKRPRPHTVTQFRMYGADYLEVIEPGQMDFVFEDTDHSYETTKIIWERARAKLKPGGWIISHDPVADEKVIRGAVDVSGEDNCLIVLVPPSDCGLLIYRKPV